MQFDSRLLPSSAGHFYLRPTLGRAISALRLDQGCRRQYGWVFEFRDLINPNLAQDQSTADQFFDEMQFESYRELGYAIAMQMYNHQCGAEDEDKKTDVEEMFFRKNS